MNRFLALCAVAATNLIASVASAEDSAAGAPKLRDLCTDRPTKSTGPCTVDPGHFQLESDIFNFVVDRTGGVDTNTYLFTNPTVKYGLTQTLDLEVSVTPAIEVTTFDRASHAKSNVTGVGDLYLRAKLNLTGDDGGTVGLALVPYLKVPTARAGIGNGAVEGGALVPMSISLPGKFSLSLSPELDLLKNQGDSGRHANLINLVGIGHAIGPVTLAGELWSDVNFDPSGRIDQYSADLGVSWIPVNQPNLQLDGGLNFGLNGVTPGVQAYVGISRRF